MTKRRTEYKLSKGPFCQSCGMPMEIPECFGTNTDKTKSDDYCCHCFQNGGFVEPNMTLEEMIDLAGSIMAEKVKMPETDAKDMCRSLIPTLKRWNKSEM